MAIWFPLMVNSQQIGELEVIRRLDLADSGDTARVYTYDWRVATFQQGTTKTAPKIVSGEVDHAYDDGAWELLRKVLNAYAKL